MKQVILGAANRRIEVTASPTSPGCVQIVIRDAERLQRAVITLNPPSADLLASAISREAMDQHIVARRPSVEEADRAIRAIRFAAKQDAKGGEL